MDDEEESQNNDNSGSSDNSGGSDQTQTDTSQTDAGAGSTDMSGGVSWDPDTGSFVDSGASARPSPDTQDAARAQDSQASNEAASNDLNSWLTSEMSVPGGVFTQDETGNLVANPDHQAPQLAMPDHNNPGQFAEWSPANTGRGLSVSDFAGTHSVPTAQQVADGTGRPSMDQAGNTYTPGGGGTPYQASNSSWNPYGANQPGSPGTTSPTARPAGAENGGPSAMRPVGGGAPVGASGFGAGLNFLPRINVSPYIAPNISPVFNNYAGGGGFGPTKATPTGVTGRGYFGSMASSSPDVWYALQSQQANAPDAFGYYPSTSQPMTAENTPWHPMDYGSAQAIDTALGVPGY